jgi:uncharacterized protein (TIGR00251 family)
VASVNEILVPVRVQARCNRNAVQGVVAGRLKVKTTAAPVDGQANRAVLTMIASEFGVPRSSVRLLRGASSRDKLFRISRPLRMPEYVSELSKPWRI